MASPPDLIYAVVDSHSPPLRLALEWSSLQSIDKVDDLRNLLFDRHAASCDCDLTRYLPRIRAGLPIEFCSSASPPPLPWNDMPDLGDESLCPADLRPCFYVKYDRIADLFTRDHLKALDLRMVPLGVDMELGTVYKVLGSNMQDVPPIVGDGDCHALIRIPGSVFVDNTYQLGLHDRDLFRRCPLLLEFASPSKYCTRYVATFLSMFHDIALLDHALMYQTGYMHLEAARLLDPPALSSYLCIEFDFSSSCTGESPPETEASFIAEFNGVLHRAFRDFFSRYDRILTSDARSLPSDIKSQDQLGQFVEWVRKYARRLKLFLVVSNFQQMLDRQLRAAKGERYWSISGSLCLRMQLIRRLLLEPIWEHLNSTNSSDRVLEKVLFTGPYFLDTLLQPPTQYKSLRPMFRDLSNVPCLQGFTRFHIKAAFDLPAELRSQKCLLLCNFFFRDDLADASTSPTRYTPESAKSVFRDRHALRAWLDSPSDRTLEPLVRQYVSETCTSAAYAALFPGLLHDPAFRTAVEKLTAAENPAITRVAHGPIFPLPDLIKGKDKGRPSLFLAGLMGKVRRLNKTVPKKGAARPKGATEPEEQTYYVIAGGCAKAALQRFVDESHDDRYREPFRLRQKTELDKIADYRKDRRNRPLPQDITRVDLSPLTSDLNLTEQALAKLLMQHYAVVHRFLGLPSDEEGFQGTFAHLLRAAVLQFFADVGFVADVQVEGWLRRVRGADGKIHLRMDVLCRARGRNGVGDRLYVFELKYFNPWKTMDATHARVEKIFGRKVLASQLKNPRGAALLQFLFELASISGLPGAHWYTDPSRRSTGPPSDLRLEHVRAFYEESIPGMPEGSTQTKVKKLVDVVSDTRTQLAEYRDSAVLGVEDNYGRAPGFADVRVTSLGPGSTEIIPFVVVNVAGALFYVEKLPSKTLNHKLAFLENYPVPRDPTKADTDAMLAKKILNTPAR